MYAVKTNTIILADPSDPKKTKLEVVNNFIRNSTFLHGIVYTMEPLPVDTICDKNASGVIIDENNIVVFYNNVIKAHLESHWSLYEDTPIDPLEMAVVYYGVFLPVRYYGCNPTMTIYEFCPRDKTEHPRGYTTKIGGLKKRY